MIGSRGMILPATAGISLGITAFAADALPGLIGELLNPTISSVLPWAGTALALGYWARSASHAAISSVSSLALAVTTYYLLTSAGSRRWEVGMAEDGGSSAFAGLSSVARAITFWLIASALAGAAIGLLGHVIARGSIYRRSLASGIAVGIIGSESWYNSLVILPQWGNDWYRMASWPVLALFAVAGVTAMAARARVSWSVAVPAGIVALGLTTAIWSQIHIVRSVL
ncbi:DUF6518 family protein [Micromonospora harpali]|uniref:DUF6518 family protein n=1 Tax=Micromonospora harpali TaxID=1490225 RepID=A0ABW1HFC3_9ACTN